MTVIRPQAKAPTMATPESLEMESLVSFQSNGTYSPVSSASQVDLQAISSGNRWLGFHLELGAANGWNGDNLVVHGHFLSMHTGDTPQHVQVQVHDKANAKWTSYTRSPGAIWIHPEGQPFSLRLHEQAEWSAAIVDSRFLDRLLGGKYALRPGVNVLDPVLEHLFRSLIAELLDPSPDDQVAQSLVRSFVLALGFRHGYRTDEVTERQGLRKDQLELILTWIEERLETPITISVMAGQLGLSAAHFSREFKRSTGRTPWEHVTRMRLDRACLLLGQGETACSTALQCGFFDQAHLSRVFKKHFHVSPGTFARQQFIGGQCLGLT